MCVCVCASVCVHACVVKFFILYIAYMFISFFIDFVVFLGGHEWVECNCVPLYFYFLMTIVCKRFELCID